MQLFIYNKEFFYKKIVGGAENEISALINNPTFASNHYSIKEIPKKNGTRKLYCIDKTSDLYKYQQNIRVNFLNNIAIPDYVYGFIPNSSYFAFLEQHTGKKYYIRLDIKNFFESIDSNMLKEVFLNYFRINNTITNKETLDALISIITLGNKLPQGAVTSPVVSNIAFRKTDIRIKKYCEKLGVTYTRYADDLLFSTNNDLLSKEHKYLTYFLKKIYFILRSQEFQLNSTKTIISEDSISLNGFVIDQSVRLSRKKLKKISAILFTIEQKKSNSNRKEILDKINNEANDAFHFSNTEALIQYIAGYRAFLIQALHNSENGVNSKINRYVNRCEKALSFFHT